MGNFSYRQGYKARHGLDMIIGHTGSKFLQKHLGHSSLPRGEKFRHRLVITYESHQERLKPVIKLISLSVLNEAFSQL